MNNHRLHRLKIQITQIFILSSAFCLLSSVCFAQSISSIDLIKNAKEYDAKKVTYKGEVVGDIMCRGDSCWVNINDGQAAIGVWMPKELVGNITYQGSYKQRGDWIRIKGIFNQSCKVHAGELDIHAQEAKIIKPGEQLTMTLDTKKRNLAIILTGVLCLVLILSRLKSS